MSSESIKFFEHLQWSFEQIYEDCRQKVADAARDYYVEQFEAASPHFSGNGTNDFGTWKPSETNSNYGKYKKGDVVDLYESGDLYNALKNVNKDWTRLGRGIKLHLEVKSDKGFDYGSFQNDDKKRKFFGNSDMLSRKVLRVYQIEFNKLKI